MSPQLPSRAPRWNRSLLLLALTGSLLGAASLAHAQDPLPHRAFDEAGFLRFPSWQPLLPTDPELWNTRVPVVGISSIHVYSDGRNEGTGSLLSALEQASLLEPEARTRALSALWRTHSEREVGFAAEERLDPARPLQDAIIGTALLACGEGAAQGVLVERLSRPDGAVGDRLAYALAQSGPKAAEVFARLAGSSAPHARLRGIWGLGEAGDSSVVSELAPHLADPDPLIRGTALEALARQDAGARFTLLLRFADDPQPALQRRMVELLAASPDPRAVPALARLADSPDLALRVAAVVALAEVPEASVRLERHLTDSVPAIRGAAARGMALHADDGQRIVLLRHGDPYVQRAAFEALEGRSDVSPRVFTALADAPDRTLRLRALNCLERQGTEDAAEAIAAFLTNPVPEVELEALRILERSGQLRLTHLQVIAASGTQAAREQAARILLALDTPEALRLLARLEGLVDPGLTRAIATRLSQGEGEGAAQGLARLLEDSDPLIRQEALRKLQDAAPDLSVDQLKVFARDPAPEVRREAVLALGARRDPRAVFVLGGISDDPSREVRHAALQALQQLGDDVAAGAVATFLQDEESGVRLRALDTLAQIGTPMAQSFVAELHRHADPMLRQKAVTILRGAGTGEDARSTEAAEQLSLFFQDPDPGVQLLAIQAVGKVADGAAISGLVAFAREQDTHIRVEAVNALGTVRDAEAVAALELFQDDASDQVRRGVYQGFAQVGGQAGYERLLEGLSDDASPVRAAVIEEVASLRLGMSVPVLLERLEAQNLPLEEETAILDALGRIRSPAAIAALVELSADNGTLRSSKARRALDTQDAYDAEAARQQLMRGGSRNGEVIVEVEYRPM